MSKLKMLSHQFVEHIPDRLADGTVYVSIPFGTVVHKCCCGCGSEVVTPLSPTDWKLTFDGESISLYPSIGNWSFPFKSHYWITRNRVNWDRMWAQTEIETGRSLDRLAKGRYFENRSTPVVTEKDEGPRAYERTEPNGSFWRRLKKWWS